MRDMYNEVTARIVAELESGALPWLKPWRGGETGTMPQNAVTSRAYSGVNVFILWGSAMVKGYTSAKWLTYRQATQLGGFVRKTNQAQDARNLAELIESALTVNLAIEG